MFIFNRNSLEILIEKYEEIVRSEKNKLKKKRIANIYNTAKYLLENKSPTYIYSKIGSKPLVRTYLSQIEYDLKI